MGYDKSILKHSETFINYLVSNGVLKNGNKEQK